MDPNRAALLFRNTGAALLLLVLALRLISIPLTRDAAARAASVYDESGRLRPLPLIIDDDGTEALPAQMLYNYADEGQSIIYVAGLVETEQSYGYLRSGWYSMPVRGGLILPAEEPRDDISPFSLRREQLFRLQGSAVNLEAGSPRGARVLVAALAPQRDAMAFIAEQPNGSHGLFVLPDAGELIWLGEEREASELGWSPDGQHLVYVAVRDDIQQLFRVSRSGGEHRQLTFDGIEKMNPVWSPDGESIAYIGADRSLRGAQVRRVLRTDIYLIPAGGGEARRLTETTEEKGNLGWVNQGQELAYVAYDPEAISPHINLLVAVDPTSGGRRRVSPPLAIEDLGCPANLPRGQERNLAVTLTNDSLLPTTAPLVLKVGQQFRPILVDDRLIGATRVETIDLPARQPQTVQWPVRPATGLFTYVTLLIDLGEHFPMDSAACVIPNTYLGLPNLAFLPAVLPLTAAGMLLLIPWLLRQKKRRLWLAYAAIPALVLALVLIEASLL